MNRKRSLWIFIIVTLASGWAGVLLDMVLTEQPEGNSLGMGLWLIAPFLAAVILRMAGRDGKGMGLKPRFRKNGKWYGVSLFIYLVVTVVTVGLAAAFGSITLSGINANLLPLMATAFLAGLVKNIFEEFAWRGYLTPKLLEWLRNDWAIYVISGLVWALWHAPYYIVFLPGIYFHSVSRAGMLLMGCVLMTCWTVMYVEIYRLTKSVWPCVLMHAVEDAIPTVLVATGEYIAFTEIGDIWWNPITGIVATGIFLGIGFWLRAVRRNRDKKACGAANPGI